MPSSKTSKVNKLLRVLVVGGVALAGPAAIARADDKPADESQKAKPAEKAQDAKDKEAKEKKAKEQAAKEKKQKEKAESDGDGVKGW